MKRCTKRIMCICYALLLVGGVWFNASDTAQAKQIAKSSEKSRVVVIDPGYQLKADMGKEPIGPGASKETYNMLSGEKNKSADYTECEMNLQIAFKLQKMLEKDGYTVILTRTANDVNISNSGRAMIANMADADIFVEITALGVYSKADSGVEVICQSDDNPYNYGNYDKSRLLSDAVLGSTIQATGSTKSQVIEEDDVAIINWCAIPTTVVEVGSLLDKDDAEKLVTDDYQEDLAKGIAAGIESYFAQK